MKKKLVNQSTVSHAIFLNDVLDPLLQAQKVSKYHVAIFRARSKVPTLGVGNNFFLEFWRHVHESTVVDILSKLFFLCDFFRKVQRKETVFICSSRHFIRMK